MLQAVVAVICDSMISKCFGISLFALPITFTYVLCDKRVFGNNACRFMACLCLLLHTRSALIALNSPFHEKLRTSGQYTGTIRQISSNNSLHFPVIAVGTVTRWNEDFGNVSSRGQPVAASATDLQAHESLCSGNFMCYIELIL